MKSCNGCIHENLKNMAWGSTQPHPCTNCSRITYDPLDKYQPKMPQIEESERTGINKKARKEYFPFLEPL